MSIFAINSKFLDFMQISRICISTLLIGATLSSSQVPSVTFLSLSSVFIANFFLFPMFLT